MGRLRKLFEPPKGEGESHAYHTRLEKKLRELLTPFQEYIQSQVTASIFLFFSMVVALIWASIPSLTHYYNSFVQAQIGFHFANFVVEQSLRFWVNDVLLTLFFFFVGLEIKREFLVGELTNHKSAVFVIMAALGGMILPALIYFFINIYTPHQLGWGIPMATDTAIALGVLSCFKRTIPKGVFTFLAALAIIDDIGAILVIAIFYTTNPNMTMVYLAGGLVLLLLLLNYAGFRKPFPYIFIGILIWFFVEVAGIHGTIAGVLVAFLIPARPERGPQQLLKRMRMLLNYFEKRKEETPLVLKDDKQHAVLQELQEVAEQATTPLQRWESKLKLPIALLILPFFALVNAGVPIDFHLLGHTFAQRVSLGILLGLLLGKPIGVILFSRFALRVKLGKLPENTRFGHIASAALLTGIGFTMSLFIANLSFGANHETLLLAKAAIVVSSIIAGSLGVICLMFVGRK